VSNAMYSGRKSARSRTGKHFGRSWAILEVEIEAQIRRAALPDKLELRPTFWLPFGAPRSIVNARCV
jgi:hypothetical protein